MPDVSEMTLEELRAILVECAGEDEEIDVGGDIAETDFADLGYDSLALLEMASRIERTRGVRIPDDLVPELRTPRAVLDVVNGTPVAAAAE
jgi:act minimal PKS acyl carrier protein